MPAQTAKRIWDGETGCGFCMRSASGAVWCRGICRTVSLSELVKRIRAVRDNPVRLEISAQMAAQLSAKPVSLHVVTAEVAGPLDRAVQRRGMVIERMVRSLNRLQKSSTTMALSKARLESTRRAITATRAHLDEAETDGGSES